MLMTMRAASRPRQSSSPIGPATLKTFESLRLRGGVWGFSLFFFRFAIQPIRPYNAPILIHGDNNLHASY
jgi:hypothetical protein